MRDDNKKKMKLDDRVMINLEKDVTHNWMGKTYRF